MHFLCRQETLIEDNRRFVLNKIKTYRILKTMSENQNKLANNESFFQRLFGSLFKSSDPEVEKRRIMKNIAKDLSKTKYKFYKASTDEVLPAFAKTFFTMYKVVAPAQSFFQNLQNEKQLQSIVFNSMLTQNQLELVSQLSEENIIAEAKTKNLQQLSEVIKNRENQLFSDFDASVINRIDTLYTQLMLFKSFCSFDYYFMLRKFASTMRELDFSNPPQFEAINGKYILDDLKDFISVAWLVTSHDSWGDLFILLKKMREIEPVAQNTWIKLVSRLREIQKSRVFEMMLKLIQQDPSYEFPLRDSLEHITENFLNRIREQSTKTINQLKLEQKTSKIDSLVVSVFGTTTVVRMKNYTEEQSLMFERRNLGAFAYHQPLNYMKAFLLDYIKKDARELADLVLVRGKWTTTTLSKTMSDSYHALLELSSQIVEFDETLADSAPLSVKLKNLLSRCERDKEASNVLHTVLGDINNNARDLLVQGTQNLILFAKNIKMILEDHQKTTPELLINWKELEHYSEKPLNVLGVEVYKQMYQFVTLIQSFLV